MDEDSDMQLEVVLRVLTALSFALWRQTALESEWGFMVVNMCSVSAWGELVLEQGRCGGRSDHWSSK